MDNNIILYSEKILKHFLISKKLPSNEKEIKEMEKIFKNLSLFIWIGKTKILSPADKKNISNNLKAIYDNCKLIDLKDKTNHIVQKLKNLNTKTEILEYITEIEYKACIIENIDPINLYKKFEKIINLIKSLSNKFSLMKFKREVKDIKIKYFKNPKNIDQLYEKLENISFS
jgi:hypothetical protein